MKVVAKGFAAKKIKMKARLISASIFHKSIFHEIFLLLKASMLSKFLGMKSLKIKSTKKRQPYY